MLFFLPMLLHPHLFFLLELKHSPLLLSLDLRLIEPKSPTLLLLLFFFILFFLPFFLQARCVGRIFLSWKKNLYEFFYLLLVHAEYKEHPRACLKNENAVVDDLTYVPIDRSSSLLEYKKNKFYAFLKEILSTAYKVGGNPTKYMQH